ncbi:MAG: DUF1109 family protein [Polyangiaceae bacterium]|nr:DUF1109 family protein [Polyangiaceae bacterium]
MTQPDDLLERAEWPGGVEPPAALSAAIRGECAAGLGKGRRCLTATQRLVRSLAIGAVTIGALVLVGGGMRPGGLAGAGLAGLAGWMSVVGIVLVVGLWAPVGHRASRWGRFALLGVLPASFAVYLMLIADEWIPLASFGAEHQARAADCGLHAIVISAFLTAAMMLVWRRTDPFSPGLSGALVGLAGGLVGALAVGAVCPTHDAWHLLLSHGTLVALLSAAGWLVGRRALAP